MRVDAERNRQRIMDAALDVFAARGTHVPMDAIARRAGVGVGTFYRHFPSRDDLLMALLEPWIHEVDSRAETVIRTAATPRLRLVNWLHEYVEFVRLYPDCAMKLVADIGDDASPVRPKWQTLLAATERVLATVSPSVLADADAVTLNRLAGGVAVIANQKDLTPDEVRAMLVHIVDGLRWRSHAKGNEPDLVVV